MKFKLFLSSAAALLALLTACSTKKADSIDLAGDWRFRIDSLNVGIDENWAATTLDDIIPLPGSMDMAGKGTPNTLEPKLEKPQVLHLTRRHSYVGPAWYQRDIDIPESMAGRPLLLELERVLWQSDLWIDGERIGPSQESVTTPHRYEIPALEAGRHTLTLRIDNSKRHDTSVDNLCHSYTDDTQVMWNGVLGRMTLAPVPEVSIADLQVYPCPGETDAVRRPADDSIRVEVTADNRTGNPVDSDISFKINGNTYIYSVTLPAGVSTVSKTVALREKLPLWSEFSPEVHTLTASLPAYGAEKSVDFGIREILADGNRLMLNGSPIFLRGTLECCIFPLTGTPPTDEEGWAKVFDTAKAYGLNHLRFHSWCPPEAAFRVADRKGVYLQVELPQWSLTVGSDSATSAFIENEYYRIAREYGNHPSFILMTCGNELQPDFDLLNGLVAKMRAHDPRHLYAASTFTFEKGHGKHPEPEDQFFVTQYTDWGWVRGQGIFDAEPPCFDKDYRSAVDSVGIPLISHEIGQYAVYPNLAEIDKYTGTLLPLNFMAVRDDLTRKGLIDRAPDWTLASGKLAAILYKEEIERALKSPGFSGFQLLDLHDFPGQGTALVGLLDAFWDSKGILTPEEFRQFCAPVVALTRFDKAVYTDGETFCADIEVANYSDRPLYDAVARWTIADTEGRVIASETTLCDEIPVGGVTVLDSIAVRLDAPGNARRLTFSIALEGTDIRNEWPLWVYPDHNADTLAADGVTVTDDFDAALASLARGEKVLLTPGTDATKGLRGKFVPVFWSPVHFPDQAGAMGVLCDPSHPALADFPTEMHTNWQWWHLLKNSRFVNLDSIEGARPIVTLVDNFANNRRLSTLFEAKVGPGSLLFSSMSLTDPTTASTNTTATTNTNGTSNTSGTTNTSATTNTTATTNTNGTTPAAPDPARRQMLYSLLRYMESPRFAPATSITPAQLASLRK